MFIKKIFERRTSTMCIVRLVLILYFVRRCIYVQFKNSLSTPQLKYKRL